MSQRILVTGPRSRICVELGRIARERGTCSLVSVGRDETDDIHADLAQLESVDAVREQLIEHDMVVLAHGVLAPQRFAERRPGDVRESIEVNLLSTVRIIECLLEGNPCVRIVVVGSESGEKGSFDICYALSKAALHAYVRERRLMSPTQQLVCVAPSVVEDAGMTTRRQEQANVEAGFDRHPKRRGLRAREVAEAIWYLLMVDEGYTTNTVLQMNGGKFARG